MPSSPRPFATIAVGPQRTASSWLDRALRQHPNLTLPSGVKETFFFDRNYERGVEWYFSHFDFRKCDCLLAEVAPTYFESESAMYRIKDVFPDCLIIINVRNPIFRSFSLFLHEYAKGRVSADFFDAVEAKPRIIESGRYGSISGRWESLFGSERVLYVVQDDIASAPCRELDKIFQFIGVESAPMPERLLETYGAGTVPKFKSLAGMASRSASFLRKAGLHKIVEVGKKAGLKNVYTGGDMDSFKITPEIFQYLLEEHDKDISFLEARLGRSFERWREFDAILRN